MRRFFVHRLSLLGLIFLWITGCMRFTQHDYDLQEKAYQKERQQQEESNKERLQMRW